MKTLKKKNKKKKSRKKNTIKIYKRKTKRKTKKTKRKTKKTKRKTKKTKRKTKKTKRDRCSPKKEGDILDFTCYTKNGLHKIKNIWNLRHPDSKIHTNNPKEIWEKISEYMKGTCNRESCWLKQNFIKTNIDKKILNHTFAPKIPKAWKKNPDEWLTSVDINRFMKQYEKTYHSFEFLGPSPIDYDSKMLYDECVWEELCKLNLKKLIKRGKTNIGIIFNLDPHYKEGSHWVAVFIKVRKKAIYYFDSYGERIPKRIMKLVKTIQNQSINLGKQYNFYENKRRHQYSNSECGMYCLYFIKTMLHTGNFNKITKKKISDKKMLKLRKIYFNP
jgi:hypothetical protein